MRLLRDANLRERLRDAREAMSSRFPLNETQWREWIADEVRHTKGKREARATVVGALFERAVADYVSVALWLGYAEFSLDQDWDHDRRRELYERALPPSAGARRVLIEGADHRFSKHREELGDAVAAFVCG